MANFSEDWTGTNGSAWPAAWTATANGGTIDIQSNAGRIVTSSTGNYVVAYASRAGVQHGEALLSFTLGNVSLEQYPEVRFRDDGSGNGYALQIFVNSNQIAFTEYVASNDTALSTVSAGLTFATGVAYRIRLLWSGISIKARVWAASDAEPSTWAIDTTRSTYSSAGNFALSVISGAAATPVTVTFDDLAVTEPTLRLPIQTIQVP